MYIYIYRSYVSMFHIYLCGLYIYLCIIQHPSTKWKHTCYQMLPYVTCVSNDMQHAWMLNFCGYTSPMDPIGLGMHSTTPRVRMVCSQPTLVAQVNMTLAVVEPWNYFGLQWRNVCYLTAWICRHMFLCFPESTAAVPPVPSDCDTSSCPYLC